MYNDKLGGGKNCYGFKIPSGSSPGRKSQERH